MPEANGGNASEGSPVAWGDLAICVAVTIAVMGIMLSPPVRRLWLGQSSPQPHKGAGV